MRRRVAILGSTGSIGTQALDVLAAHSDRFELVGLGAGRNVTLLREQQARFGVEAVAVASSEDAALLRHHLGSEVRIGSGAQGMMSIATSTNAEVLLVATDGAVAFQAAFAAVELGIDLAVANKELIVAAGELLIPLAKERGVRILPVDSEHSAIFQCLVGEPEASVERIILTASGGPFRAWSAERLATASVQDALAHPTWSMGVKNTVDSATLMNKGLEVIEASRLFSLPAEQIDVLVHPTSLVHGFVVFTDGNIKAQIAAPDMRLPIGYALSYPERLPGVPGGSKPDALALLGALPEMEMVDLRFERVDDQRFPALGLAYQALRDGGTMPCALSAANEIAVSAFYDRKISFTGIARMVEAVLAEMPREALSLDSLARADSQARALARDYIERCQTTA